MTPRQCLYVYVLVVLIVFLQSTNSYSPGNKNDIVKEILNTLTTITNNNEQLKDLVKTFVKSTSNEENFMEGCECTPFYLCDKGQVITDGTGAILPRGNFNPCTRTGEICCTDLKNPVTTIKPTSKIAKEDCGYSFDIKVNLSSPLDASTSKFGEFPWTVILLAREIEYVCVGSLIHPQVVLTSAHCVKNRTDFTVRAGEWNKTVKTEPYPHQNVKVKNIIVHPKFNDKNFYYNVALLILETSVKLDANVRTACLADEFIYDTSYPSSACAATGWGLDWSLGMYPKVMKKINFSLMSHTMCQLKFQNSRLGKKFELHKSFVCGMNERNQDLCNGDGGGPFVCPIQAKPLRFQQVGITSWALTCDSDFPSVFTDISYVKNWIDAQFYALKLNTKFYTP